MSNTVFRSPKAFDKIACVTDFPSRRLRHPLLNNASQLFNDIDH